jgi:succinate dehydrogenase / fumarate reductase cytochrome b subunit
MVAVDDQRVKPLELNPNTPHETKVSATLLNHSKQHQFFLDHEFAIRRVHSLLGIVPLGLYMVVHLATNASLLNGPETFQRMVYVIHSPGRLLPLIEWGLIFLPLIFHAVIGVWIAKTGRINSDQYRFTNNRRYTFQRWTGFIALVYLFFHVLHLHGWFHAEFWLGIIRPLNFGQFAPYNAASSLVIAMNHWVWPPFYLIGVLACVYHLANGLWTAGITWGLWISPAAQARASKVCGVVGLALTVVAVSAWWAAVGPTAEDAAAMRRIEDRMYGVVTEAGIVTDVPHKRTHDK